MQFSKILAFLALLCSLMLPAFDAHGQKTYHVDISADLRRSACFRRPHTFSKVQFASVADSAFRIVSAVFNSQLFQKQVLDTDFKCDGYCSGCAVTPHTGGRIPGTFVMERIFKDPRVSMVLDLDYRGGALGETLVNSDTTTAYYWDITNNMRGDGMSFAYQLAVNLCHEYMHRVGFCHLYCAAGEKDCPPQDQLDEPDGGERPDPKFIHDDVTYAVGWIAFHILRSHREDLHIFPSGY